jgi:C-3',4' desaturase CrtD
MGMGNGRTYDLVVIGSGIGGLAAAGLVAQKGKKVLVLESNYLPGGCCSSYYRKGYVFETGATTLMGFDEGQPLHLLQQQLGFDLEMQEINPAMTVWMDGQKIIRPKAFGDWLTAAIQSFGQADAQRKFWQLAYRLSNFVWKVSGKTLTFPPTSVADLWALARRNRIADYPKLRYAFITVEAMLRHFGLATNRRLVRFLDEQLLITAQATTSQVPFLFAAPALCYTNYSNYYLPGGMIRLAEVLIRRIGELGGDVRVRAGVVHWRRTAEGYNVTDTTGRVWKTRNILSNIPIWNLPTLADQREKPWFERQAQQIKDYWGAFTLGQAFEDQLPTDATLHHQFILPEGQTLPHTGSKSVFMSVSERGDTARSPLGTRVAAFSTHAHTPKQWLDWYAQNKEDYKARKQTVAQAKLKLVHTCLPELAGARVLHQFESTPVSWVDWIGRHEGTVGGIPQNVSRSIFSWLGAKTPFRHVYLCGDTVYPGQGVPGVALGGIIAAHRILATS